jgi:hypothetical protein
MEYSLLKEVNKKTLSTFIQGRTFTEMYWPNFFPLKSTPFLTFETLMGDVGSRVAADIVAYNTSAPEKTRKVVSKLSGDIPAIRVKRSMKETDINAYNILKAQASGDDQAILELVFEDSGFVFEAVMARLEWMALQAMSYGQITLSKSNNGAGVITENVLDYQVPAGNKIGVGTVWSNAAAATPITDFNTVVTAATAIGVKLKYTLMNPAAFALLRATAEMKDYCAVLVGFNGGRVKLTPGIDAINAALAQDGKPEIKIIDTSVGTETEDHVISYANPWKAGYITYIPDIQIGRTLHGPLAEETNPPKQVVQAKRGPVLISKYSDVDPVTEYTKGEANACPVWANPDRCFIQKIDGTTWS